jgi:hypothetical protein
MIVPIPQYNQFEKLETHLPMSRPGNMVARSSVKRCGRVSEFAFRKLAAVLNWIEPWRPPRSGQ